MQPPIDPVLTLIDPLPYIDARCYRRELRRAPPLWIVIHATHGAEGSGKARQGAHELAHPAPGSKQRSAHAFVDASEVVQCVPWDCEAWHCGSTGNRLGEGIELCGRADQTTAQWFDDKSLPMLRIAARLVRWRCDVRGIPLEFLTAAELREFQSGITTHAEVSRAFRESNHWDPGPCFPIAAFLGAVRLAVGGVELLRRD